MRREKGEGRTSAWATEHEYHGHLFIVKFRLHFFPLVIERVGRGISALYEIGCHRDPNWN